ncbi:MAG: hypothetical protein ACP5D3_05145 [Sulfurovum sp.]
MENIKKKMHVLKQELSLCKDRALYGEMLESHITQLSNEILSDPDLSKKIDRNSKIFFLSNRLKDTLKRKVLMDRSSEEERTEQISEFIEQINSEALMYAEEIFSTLLKELGIPDDIKNPSVQEKKKKFSTFKQLAGKKVHCISGIW